MPLRVAEKDGCIYAVDGCGDCPFNGWDGYMITVCGHEKAKDPSMLYRDRIPVWCPLPTGEYKVFKVLEPENKLDIHSDHIKKVLPNP